MVFVLARTASAAPKVIAVDVDGVVHPVTTEIVASAIERARQENAALVLVRLNTPGGLMDAMRETIEKMLASPVPVVTYVAPSGGRVGFRGLLPSGSRRCGGHGARAPTPARRIPWPWAARWTR